MKISTDTAAQVSYKIHNNDINGELIEFSDVNSPRLLIFGNQMLIPGIEKNLQGLTAGDEFQFSLTPDESFGNYRNEMVVDVPKSAFMINGVIKDDLLYLGKEINMRDSHGNTVAGRVIEINDDNVKMDFNHRLAGSSLYVAGRVHNVRAVTQEDLAPQGCGTGCGCSSPESSGDSCCSTEKKEKSYDEDCPSCGNPAHLRGKGHGNCGCG